MNRLIAATSVLAAILTGILALGAATGHGQCYQPATRKLGPYPPDSGSVKSLENPLLDSGAAPTSTLKIVTLGDSVVWGNGNADENKFSVKVARDLANATGRQTEVVAYAHSGANLTWDKSDTSKVFTDGQGADLVYQMDLNTERPTIVEQADCASTQDSDAELVILDGCINDVNAMNVAVPFPFNWTTPDALRSSAYRNCSTPMQALLRSVKADFPEATIIITGYYQIVTEKSTPQFNESVTQVPNGTGVRGATPKRSTDELQSERQKLLQLAGQRGTAEYLQFNVQTGSLFSWQANSVEFRNTTRDCFRWAVASSDGIHVDPLDDSEPHPSCPTNPNDIPPPAQRATHDVRVFLAEVADAPGFGYGAPQTHVWRIPSKHHPDGTYKARIPLCNEHYKGHPLDHEVCMINATAHPNEVGAEAYHRSIWALLQAVWAIPAPN